MASIVHRPECIDAPFQMEMDSASDDTPSLKRKSISLNEDTDTPITELSREQKRELRKRLKMELEQVQGINMKLEYLEQQARSSSEREVSSLVPPPIDVSRLARQSSYVSELGTPGSTKEKRTPKANQMYANSDYFSAKDKMPPPEKVKPKQLVPPKKGLKSEYDLKRQKVDQARSKRLSDLLKQCGNVLKKLMIHKFAWVFNTPVDAVKLGLHDYHKVIRRPMDLGTIKKKLESHQYGSPVEFAEDIKLTFSNAMTYNPPGHDVFLMAETLKKMFEERWKSVSEKLEEDLTRRRAEDEVLADFAGQNQVKQLPLNEDLGSKKVAGLPRAAGLKKPAKRLMTYEEKNELGKNLETVLEKSPPDKVDEIVQLIKKHHPNLSQSDDTIEVDIDGIDNDTLWELHRMVANCCMKVRTKKRPVKQDVIVDAVRTGSAAPGTSPKRGKNSGEGVEEDVDIDVGDEKPMGEIPSVVIDKDAPDKDKSSGESSSSSSGSSSSESDSGSSSGSDSDAEGPRTAGNEKPSSQKEPNGAVREQVSSPSRKVAEKPMTESPEEPDVVQNGDSTEAQDDKSAEKAQSERVSPEKSLRAAMLKGRFADTILKAREKTFPLKNDNVDPEKLRKEREELERKQKEDKARLQAEAKAAEAVRLKKEAEAASEARKKRELEREAARRALQQMERTVDLDAHHEILKDFELMRSSSMEHLQCSAGEVSPANSGGGGGGGIPGFTLLQSGANPLEQLGLFMKEEDEEDEEKQGDGEVAYAEGTDENGEVEEGEIDI